MRTVNVVALMATLTMGLGACASFDGIPKPVIPVATSATIPDAYKIQAALEKIDSSTVTDKVAFRNRTIAIYLSAADARYYEFRSNLAKDLKGTNLGLDLGALTFSSIGAIAKGAANELSAGAALMNGAKGSINKELYFERTLPALIATMDGNRIKARSSIVLRMREGVDTYPLEMAFSDLAAYEMAASLDGAVQQLTADANRSTAQAVESYENAVEACRPAKGIGVFRGQLNRNVLALAAPDAAGALVPENVQALSKIAALLGVTPAAVATTTQAAGDQADAIKVSATSSVCGVDAIKALFTKIRAIEAAEQVKIAPADELPS